MSEVTSIRVSQPSARERELEEKINRLEHEREDRFIESVHARMRERGLERRLEIAKKYLANWEEAAALGYVVRKGSFKNLLREIAAPTEEK